MNLKEVKKIVYVDILIICFTIICLVFSLCYILFGDIDVKAATLETNLTSSISIPTEYSGCSQSNGKYWADDGSSNTCHVFNTKTSYSGVIYSLEFIIKGGWYPNEPAFININAMSTDFRNNNLYCTLTYNNNSIPCNLTFNSKSQLTISFTPEVASRNYTLGIYSSSYSAITGINTFGIKSVISKQYTGDNSDIINSQNQNTQDIIDNANENADSINNTLQDIALDMHADQVLTADEIRYQTEVIGSGCLLSMTLTRDEWGYTKDKYLASDGSETSNSTYSISPYLVIKPGASYTLDLSSTSANAYFCQYTPNKQVIGSSCTSLSNNSMTFTARNNAGYLRISLGGGRTIDLKGPVCNDFNLEEQKKILDKAQEEIDYLKDDSDPTLNNSGINSALSAVEIDDPLNYLLTLPISLLQKLNTVLSSNSCQRVSFGSLYNTELYLPCINFSELLGTNIWNTIDLFVGVGLLAVILKKFYESISNILTLGKEKEVKDKLDLPTPMEFLASILGGGKD